MTKEVSRDELVKAVARRMISEMHDEGGVDVFCEKMLHSPQYWITLLAAGAVDCIGLSECLSPRVVYRPLSPADRNLDA